MGNSPRELARGDVAEGGSQAFPVEGEWIEVDVTPGRVLRLSIDPAGNYGADSTILEWTVEQLGSASRVWRLSDVIDEFAFSNPRQDALTKRPAWIYLDGRGTGTNLLAESVRGISGQAGLDGWRTGDNPAVFVNANLEPVSVWTKLPARTVFAHPAPDGAVAVGWISPVEGRVRMRGRVADGHPGGANGVGWKLEAFDGDGDQRARIAGGAFREPHRDGVKTGRLDETGSATGVRVRRRRRDFVRCPRPPAWRPRETRRCCAAALGWSSSAASQFLLERAVVVAIGWLVGPTPPILWWRGVLVNRVWQHHFGRGLVATPNDLARADSVHRIPKLLDFWRQGLLRQGGA